MQKPLIYLGGPIHGLNQEQATGWRDAAAGLLAPEFGVLDPMAAKTLNGTDYSHYTDAEIVTRDLFYIRQARAVLRYVPNGSTEGSAMETFYAAHTLGLPVVTWGPGQSDRSNLSLWLRHFTVRGFESLGGAVDYLKTSWLLPGDQATY